MPIPENEITSVSRETALTTPHWWLVSAIVKTGSTLTDVMRRLHLITSRKSDSDRSAFVAPTTGCFEDHPVAGFDMTPPKHGARQPWLHLAVIDDGPVSQEQIPIALSSRRISRRLTPGSGSLTLVSGWNQSVASEGRSARLVPMALARTVPRSNGLGSRTPFPLDKRH